LKTFVYVLSARAVLLLHLFFILYVVFGGFLVRRWKRTVWLHLPVMAWGTGISFIGWSCPLTPLEKWFLQAADYPAYPGSCLEHYLIEMIYPAGLTLEIQYLLGGIVLVVNAWAYGPMLLGDSRD
jgi:hypothetical protein